MASKESPTCPNQLQPLVDSRYLTTQPGDWRANAIANGTILRFAAGESVGRESDREGVGQRPSRPISIERVASRPSGISEKYRRPLDVLNPDI